MGQVITDPTIIGQLEKAPDIPALAGAVTGQAGRIISDPAIVAELEKDEQQQPQQSWIARGVSKLADLGKSAYGAAFPERDPDTKDIPAYSHQGISDPDLISRIERSKFTTAGFEDAPWRRRLLETLGPRVTNIRKDKFGNEIIKYKGDDGQEHEAYINRPGIDTQDVSRAVHGTIPYLVAGGIARKVAPAASLLTRAPAQAGAAAGVSLGQDIAAGEPIGVSAIGKAATTGAMGAAGEVAGTVAPKVWRYFFQPQYADEATGLLTAAGRKEAERLGLDPNTVQGEVARRLGDVRRAHDPQAAAAGIETGAFGIPTTLGQRTKDPAQLGIEEQMRRSLFGPGAREVISEFDTQQADAIRRAAQGVRGQLAPQGAGSLPEAGQSIGEGLRGAQAASRDKVAQAWKEIEDLYPVLSQTATGNEARGLLTQSLRGKFDDLGFFPDQQLTPSAHKMMGAVTEYSKAMPPAVPYEILGPSAGRAPSLDNMRRRLLAQYQGAQPGQDRAAARAIYDGFNDWVESVSQQQFIRNTAGQFTTKDQAAKLAMARQITREERQLFSPTDPRNRLTPAGKILGDLADNADTPERIVQTLFGTSLGATPKAGTVDAVARLKQVLPPEKFDQVKSAYFLKMVTGNQGDILSPANLNTSVGKAFASQKSVIDAMFTQGEQAFIQDFKKAVALASYRPANPSGTSYELERMRRQRQMGPLHYVLKRMGTRSTFQGEIWQGTMYHWLARTLPNIFNLQEAASRSMARKAIGQAMDFKPDTGELAAALLAAHEARKSGNPQ